jgi:hypothetical protein
MARIEVKNDLVTGISGRVGNMVFRTYKNGKVGMYPYKKPTRKAGLKPNEIKSRERFRIATNMYNSLGEDERKSYEQLWIKSGRKYKGKEYVTLRGYVFARLYEHLVV